MVFISVSLIYWVPGSEIGQNVGVGILSGNSWSQTCMDDQERVWFSSPSETKSGNDWSHSSQKGIWSPISSFNFEKESEDLEPFFRCWRKLLS